jgi:regulator of cell morphogenesis and NO signaling
MPEILETTVGEIAARSMGAVRVFESLGIDYCCGGKRTAAEVCREKGISPEQLEAALRNAGLDNGNSKDWTKAPLRELTNHIVATHHEFLKLELPRIAERMRKVVAVHGSKDAETLRHLAVTFAGLNDELTMHLHKEEMILFPAIERYESALNQGLPLPPAPFGSIANPIAAMEHEHESAGAALQRIRQLTNDFELPPWACNTVRALWKGLEELETDTHQHIGLENNVLHPRTIALERDAVSR